MNSKDALQIVADALRHTSNETFESSLSAALLQAAERIEDTLVKESSLCVTDDGNLHRDIHKKLHKALDELTADFIQHSGGKLPSNTTVAELMEWSYGQTITPTEDR